MSFRHTYSTPVRYTETGVEECVFIRELMPMPEMERVYCWLDSIGIHDGVISGGALRDHLHGVPVKDIDVFVHGAMLGDRQIIRTPGLQYAAPERSSAPTWVSHPIETFVSKAPVQIINTARRFTAETLIADHDIGLCQIAYLRGGTLLTTQAFQDDFHTCKLTVTLPPHQTGPRDIARTVERLERLLAKYPSHSVRDPQGLLGRAQMPKGKSSVLKSVMEWLR